MAVGTTAFPTSLDTIVELVEITNNASSTLSGNVLIGDTTIGVTDIGEFPTTGYGTIVDDLTSPSKVEIISWTGKSGSNLTGCTRGTQGTSAAAFSSGNYIEVRPTAGHHEALRGAVIAIETKLGTGSTIAVNKLAALTASKAVVTDGSGFLASATVTAAELGYLSGVTTPTGSGALVLATGPTLSAPSIARLANLTSNGFVKTGSGNGTLSIDTSTYLTANQTITLSSDVTGSGTTGITATIASGAVTYAKMQNISATQRVLGRNTAGAGTTEEVTITQLLDWAGTAAQGDILYRGASAWALLPAGTNGHYLKTQGAAANPVWAAVSGGGLGDVVGPASSTDNAVVRFDLTTGKLIQDSVVTIADTTGNMAGVGTLNTHTIPGGSADTFALIAASQSLTNKKLGSLTSNGFVKTSGGDGTLSVDTSTYLTANQTVTLSGDVTGSGATAITTTIASAAVTYAKIQNVSAQYRILARKSASAGSVEECTLSEVLDFVTSAAQGDILYRGAANWERLGAGTSGYFLKTQGAAANPTWAAAVTTSNKLGDFAATTSAELAGVISDETGSGVLVFGTSPAITTSLTTASASFDLLNANATTINFGGAATALNMAGGSGAVVKIGGGVNAASLRFMEPSGSGSNFTEFKAQAQAGDITYTLPASLTNGYYLQTDGSGNLSWAAVAGGSGLTIGTTAITSGTGGRILYETSGNVVGEIAGSSVDANGAVQFAATARSSGVAQYFRINTPADTGQTASTESVGVYFGGNGSGSTVTRTWAVGAIALQRENVFIAPTYAFASGSNTITEAATVEINGAPIAGAGVSFTRRSGLSFGGWTGGNQIMLSNISTPVFLGSDGYGVFLLGTNSNNTGRYLVAAANGYLGVLSGSTIGWSSSSSNFGAGSTPDTAFARAAAAVIRVSNGSTGAGKFIVGSSSASTSAADLYVVGSAAGTVPMRVDSAATPSADIVQFTINGTNAWQLGSAGAVTMTSQTANTSTVATAKTINVNSTGTAAAGFGGQVLYQLETTTTDSQPAAALSWLWTTATHASRTSAITLSTVDNAASLAERWRLSTNGAGTGVSTTTTGFFGGTNVTGMLSESITLNTGGTTTDSTIDLPANSIILSVTGRVTTTITTATDWKLGDATIADRFSDANATLTAGTTTVGINQWKADRTTAGQGAFQQSTAKVRITTTGTPGAGVIRITIHYITLSAPTS